MDDSPSFPPLLNGIEVGSEEAPLARAVADAESGSSEPGNLYWSSRQDAMRTALMLAPDRTLTDAMPAVFAVACGVHDSLGALAPPETGVTHLWPDTVIVNGAACGVLSAAASTRDRLDIPEWLAVSVDLMLGPVEEDPGNQPGRTTLTEEGCAALTSRELIESWARHSLVWIHRWMEDGFRPLHDAWFDHAEKRGEPVRIRHRGEVLGGKLLGVDERGDLLLEVDEETRHLELVDMLDYPAVFPPEPIP